MKNSQRFTCLSTSHLDGELLKGKSGHAMTLTSLATEHKAGPLRNMHSTKQTLLIFVLNNCSNFYPKLEIYAIGRFLSTSLLNFYFKEEWGSSW